MEQLRLSSFYFGDDGQHVVGKQVGAVLRSNRGGDEIPADIAQVVCKKFTWHFNNGKEFPWAKKDLSSEPCHNRARNTDFYSMGMQFGTYHNVLD